jgi:hypothetical protein
MDDTPHYYLQFFRQWLGDTGIEDIPAEGSLEHAKALAQANLEAFAREGAGRGRPRVARIVERESREILSEFRLTHEGPVETSRPTAKTSPAARSNVRLRLVEGSETPDR